jgi:AcrR family transcriptional regulator
MTATSYITSLTVDFHLADAETGTCFVGVAYINVAIITGQARGERATMAKDDARRHHADGDISRAKILTAATEIATERGYDGTSISAVSAKCGLPASSIYWHFKDKDDLLCAVIERSFATAQMPENGTAQQRGVAIQSAKALLDSPDFIRLGLMLVLEHRPVEPRARAMFLHVRAQAYAALATELRDLIPGLPDAQLQALTTYALAGVDGLFIGKEIGGDAVNLVALLEMHAHAINATAHRMITEKDTYEHH